MKISNYHQAVDSKIKQLEKQIEINQTHLKNSYLHRFHWDADQLYKDLFFKNFLLDLFETLTDENNVDKQAEVLQCYVNRAKEFLLRKQFSCSSTSALQNLTKMWEGEVYADFLKNLQYYGFVNDNEIKI